MLTGGSQVLQVEAPKHWANSSALGLGVPQAQHRPQTHRIQRERLIQLKLKVFLDEAHIPSSVACQLLGKKPQVTGTQGLLCTTLPKK